MIRCRGHWNLYCPWAVIKRLLTNLRCLSFKRLCVSPLSALIYVFLVLEAATVRRNSLSIILVLFRKRLIEDYDFSRRLGLWLLNSLCHSDIILECRFSALVRRYCTPVLLSKSWRLQIIHSLWSMEYCSHLRWNTLLGYFRSWLKEVSWCHLVRVICYHWRRILVYDFLISWKRRRIIEKLLLRIGTTGVLLSRVPSHVNCIRLDDRLIHQIHIVSRMDVLLALESGGLLSSGSYLSKLDYVALSCWMHLYRGLHLIYWGLI